MTTMQRIRSKDLETGSVNARVLAAGAIEGRHIGSPMLRRLANTGTIDPDALEAGGVTAPKIGNHAVEARAIAQGAIEIAKFAQSLRPVQLVDTLPALPDPDYPSDEAVVFLKSEGKLYRNVADVWTAKVPTVDLEGQITETQITDAAISTPKLAALSIVAEKIATNAITAGKIAADAVTAGTISAGAVNTRELAADAINADKIQARAIGAEQMAALYMDVTKYIRSANYVGGSAGWAIDGDGNAEFNSVTIRNGVYAGGTITAATFQTATSGARVVIASGADGVTFYNSNGQSSTLRLGVTDGLETSGSLRVGGSLADRTLYTGAAIIAGGDGNGGATIDTTGEVRGTDLLARGNVFAQGHDETANAANCVISTSGRLLRSTSVRDSKTDIAVLTEPEWRTALQLQPVSFHSALDGDDPTIRHLGLVAEDVAMVDPSLVLYDEYGIPRGVAYDRTAIPLLGLVQEHHRRILDVEGRLAILEGAL